MARCSSAILPILILMSCIFGNNAYARSRLLQDTDPLIPIAEASPILAPFQHVRFCLRYPDDCKSNPTENGRIDLNDETLKLLYRVNRDVNAAISPMVKAYGSDLQDGWTISPVIGDCNDYAVTKRHELLQKGLPPQALRLSVVKTVSGIGHLVLVVATTKGDLVLDNLTETIRPWQNTDYHWLKIQSATDARFWYEVKAASSFASQASREMRLADR
jgi:predicted transglutaminase-like cysteine proteinase